MNKVSIIYKQGGFKLKKKGYGNKVEEEKKCLTTSHGNLIEDDENSKTIGNDGPVLLEDIGLLDKIAQFDRENS